MGNGTLDLKAHSLRPHNPDDLLTRTTLFDYDPEAKCPSTLKLIGIALGLEGRELTEGERHQRTELMSYLQQLIGYSLCGAPTEKCFIFLNGAPDAGKSFIQYLLKRLAGTYYLHIASEALMGKSTAGNTPQLAMLKGARVVTTSETEASQVCCKSLLKDITGRDSLTVTAKYADPVTITPQCVVWLFGNERPEIGGGDQGFWNRMKVIPFEQPIPPKLRQKAEVWEKIIGDELSGLLNWALEGLWQVQRTGLQDPELVRNATNGYQKDCDLTSEFLTDCCLTEADLDSGHTRLPTHIDPEAELVVPHTDLYLAYQLWSERCGFKPSNKRTFNERLKTAGYDNSGYRPGNRTHWAGITLNGETDIKRQKFHLLEYERPSPGCYSTTRGYIRFELNGGAK